MCGLVVLVALWRGAGAEAPPPPPVPVYAAPGDVSPPPPLVLHLEPWEDWFCLRLCGHLDPVLRLAAYETEDRRCYVRIGRGRSALGSDWYLGHGLAVEVEWGYALGRSDAPISLLWHPAEGLALSVGFDAFRWRPVGGVWLRP